MGEEKKKNQAEKKQVVVAIALWGRFHFCRRSVRKGTCVHWSRLPFLDVPASALLGKPGGGNDS